MLLHMHIKCKLTIIGTFITPAHISEVMSTTWLIFGPEIPQCVGAWASKIQIYNALFHQVISQRSRKCKNQLHCLNLDTRNKLTHRSAYFSNQNHKFPIPYAWKFPQYVNFTDFAVTYIYSKI